MRFSDWSSDVCSSDLLHLIGNDVGAVAVGAGILVLPLACLKAALDIDRTAFFQVFAGDFSQTVVENKTVPFGLLALFARGLVFPLRGRGNGYVTNSGADGAVAHFRVLSESSEERRGGREGVRTGGN